MSIHPEANAPGSPGQIADEQFVHGLLGFLHDDDADTQQTRIDRLMRAIDGGAERATTPRRRVPWPALLTAAAVFVVVAVFGLSRPPDARAVVEAAIEAAPDGPERRYRVETFARHLETPIMATTIDIRDSDHVLLRAEVHGVPTATLGRHRHGSWVIDLHGDVHKVTLGERWPRWVNAGGHAILFDTVDDLLARLPGGYELELAEPEELAAWPGSRFDRVLATRRDETGIEPHEIDVWLDEGSRLVRRMELRWQQDQNVRVEHHLHQPDSHRTPFVLHVAGQHGPQHTELPHRMVFELIGTPDLAPEWFAPETHAK